MGFALGRSLVRSAGTLWSVEDGSSPFQQVCHAGVWERVFDTLASDRDNLYLMIDSTTVRAHQQAATGKGGAQDQSLGRSRGGLTTKIHTLADRFGRPLRFLITPGQASDVAAAPDPLRGQRLG